LRRNAQDWYYLGLCESNCGRVDAALAALDKSRSIDPTSPGTYVALAAIHRARKEFDAERQVKEAGARVSRWILEQSPTSPP
jgi:cytochrome c-type biogenesis protein CcmH/NrfG